MISLNRSEYSYIPWDRSGSSWEEESSSWLNTVLGYCFTMRSLAEINAADQEKHSAAKNIREMICITGTYIDHISYILRFVESVMADENGSFQELKAFFSAINVSTDMNYSRSRMFIEQLILRDNWKKNGSSYREFAEAICSFEKNGNNAEKINQETIFARDGGKRYAEKIVKRNIRLCEDLQRFAEFIRNIGEVIYLTDELKKMYGKNSAECLKVVGDILHHANAIISDIIFADAKVTADAPAGYSEFIPFIPGDYTYEKALFRALVSGSVTGKKAVIDEFLINVDLPDIHDGGKSDIEAEETKVMFNRKFYRVPEVTITMHSAEGVLPIPVINEITRDYFKVTLKNSNGASVRGKISWTALGC